MNQESIDFKFECKVLVGFFIFTVKAFYLNIDLKAKSKRWKTNLTGSRMFSKIQAQKRYFLIKVIVSYIFKPVASVFKIGYKYMPKMHIVEEIPL